MPSIDDLLKLDNSLNHTKRTNVSKKGFMDTKVIDAYHDIQDLDEKTTAQNAIRHV